MLISIVFYCWIFLGLFMSNNLIQCADVRVSFLVDVFKQFQTFLFFSLSTLRDRNLFCQTRYECCMESSLQFRCTSRKFVIVYLLGA